MQKVLEDYPQQNLSSTSANLEVCCYSDVPYSSGFNYPRLKVDIAVLKNCAVPLTAEEKKQLRTKYNVDSSKPVLVVGFAESYGTELEQIVTKLSKDTNIYLIGNSQSLVQHYRGYEGITVVEKYGVLKYYYAMADIAINAHNLAPNVNPLHNFVEATEGGAIISCKA